MSILLIIGTFEALFLTLLVVAKKNKSRADVTPWRFENGSALGVSLEVFRSFQAAYTDYYQLGEMPGLSYLKFGVVYRFNK